MAHSRIARCDHDHFEIVLENADQDAITMLQVTDLHLGNKGSWKKDFDAVRRVKALVNRYQPDVIAVTGDLFTGEKECKEYLTAFAVQFFDDLERPWIYVFGNHDPEGNTGREPIRRIIEDSEWGVLGFHDVDQGTIEHDFLVDVKRKGEDKPDWQFFAFDSGSEKGRVFIQPHQLAWFEKRTQGSMAAWGQTLPAVALFHIPFRQYQMLWEDPTLHKTGFCHERVCFEEDDGRAYEAFVKQGNIRACFCGHDHDNNYWGTYHGGILLVYGHVSGESCYRRQWPPGAKLVRLPIPAGDLTITDLALPKPFCAEGYASAHVLST